MSLSTPPRLTLAQHGGGRVRLAWTDGFEAEFAAAWLLDNAPPTGESVGGQRLRSARALALAGPLLDLTLEDDAVRLRFAAETATWTGAELRARAEPAPRRETSPRLWPAGVAMAARRTIAFADYLSDDAALAAALDDVARLGLVRLTGAGLGPEALEAAVGRFGFIRETNYGRLFEVRVTADPDNLAYTARALEPHTDNPYRDPVPTLQLLHGVETAGEGGETFFLDGLALAEDFRAIRPDDFARLATTAVPFAFAAAGGERYETRTPVLRLTAGGAVAGVRFNHRALGSVDLAPAETQAWYGAYLRFADEADAPQRRLSFRIGPGDIVLFDNERILHGRAAFPGTARRLLRGCYADRDGLLAALARVGLNPPDPAP